jgi:hypothetical protein
MNKPNSTAGAATDMSASHSISQGQVFGYVQSTRLVRLGKLRLVYRLPNSGKRLTVSKPLVLFLALLLTAFASGYVNDRRVLNQRAINIQPTAVVPVISFHRLITIGAVHGPSTFPSMQFREV